MKRRRRRPAWDSRELHDRSASEAARRRAHAASSRPVARLAAAAPALPAATRESASRWAASGARGADLSRRTATDPGRRRASHAFPGQVSPTATVSQSTPVSTTATSRGAAAASKVSVSTSPRVNCFPHATKFAAARHAQDLLTEELRMRRGGSEQRDASFLESSLRPRRALPSELGSRRAAPSSTSASQRCA